MIEIFLLILPVFLIIALGSGLKLLGIADDSWVDVLNKFGLYVGFPVLIFSSLVQLHPLQIFTSWKIFAAIFLGIAIVVLLTKLVLWKVEASDPVANAVLITTFFGNVAYMGYPVVMTVYPGKEADLSIIVSIYVIYLFTAGLFFLEWSKNRQVRLRSIIIKMFTNPYILAILAGFFVSLSEITLPAPLLKAMDILKGSATPVVLVSLGIFLTRGVRVRPFFKPLVAILVVKVILMPFFFYNLLRFDSSSTLVHIAVLEAAMPVAISPFALASIYPIHRELVVSAIILSTTISVFSLPLILTFLRQ